MRFFRRGKGASDPRKPSLDLTGKTPAVRASICTGEQVAGFKDTQTGRFTEVILIRTEADFEEFLQTYGLTAEQVERIY